jgi:hypothetical protein
MEVDLERGLKTVPMTANEIKEEKLARFLVNELGLLPANGDDRRSVGHKWERARERERDTFRRIAKELLNVVDVRLR